MCQARVIWVLNRNVLATLTYTHSHHLKSSGTIIWLPFLAFFIYFFAVRYVIIFNLSNSQLKFLPFIMLHLNFAATSLGRLFASSVPSTSQTVSQLLNVLLVILYLGYGPFPIRVWVEQRHTLIFSIASILVDPMGCWRLHYTIIVLKGQKVLFILI
jgi:hypothetical protein